jgi:hypothetical protein
LARYQNVKVRTTTSVGTKNSGFFTRFDMFTSSWVGSGSSPPNDANSSEKTGTTKMSMPVTISTAMMPTAIG